MQIRTRLTLQFVGIVAMISLVSHLSIYYFSEQYRESQFYDRLRDKANTTADLLIKVDAVTADLLRIIDKNKKDLLYKENITVYNYLNEPLYSSNDSINFGTSNAQLNDIRKNGEHQWRQGDFEVIGIPFFDQYNRFVVTAGGIDKYGRKKMDNLEWVLVISYFFSLVIVAWSGWIYAGRSLKPVTNIINQVNAISATNLSTRLDEGNQTDELAKLSSTFNSMLARIDNTFQMQKAFVANASHEIKNPLAVITSQIEISLLRERTPEEYRETLTSVLEDARKLNIVSLRLLDLARLNSEEIRIELSPMRVDELLWQCKDDIVKKNPEYRINFTPELPEEPRQLIVAANEHLLKTAFMNLLDNACKFSHGKEVQLLLQTVGSSIIIQVKDEGIGITENDLPFIFEPFYRGANSVPISGHGIGLSLVEKIMRLHNAEIKVESTAGVGTTFTVTMRSASL